MSLNCSDSKPTQTGRLTELLEKVSGSFQKHRRIKPGPRCNYSFSQISPHYNNYRYCSFTVTSQFIFEVRVSVVCFGFTIRGHVFLRTRNTDTQAPQWVYGHQGITNAQSKTFSKHRHSSLE